MLVMEAMFVEGGETLTYNMAEFKVKRLREGQAARVGLGDTRGDTYTRRGAQHNQPQRSDQPL